MQFEGPTDVQPGGRLYLVYKKYAFSSSKALHQDDDCVVRKPRRNTRRETASGCDEHASATRKSKHGKQQRSARNDRAHEHDHAAARHDHGHVHDEDCEHSDEEDGDRIHSHDHAHRNRKGGGVQGVQAAYHY